MFSQFSLIRSTRKNKKNKGSTSKAQKPIGGISIKIRELESFLLGKPPNKEL